MRSIETRTAVPLASVKPLERIAAYREHCIEATGRALEASGSGRRHRDRSPVSGARLESIGEAGPFAYGRCPDTGSLFLLDLPDRTRWARLLAEVTGFRHSPEAFHLSLSQSREDHVYRPKVEWIEDALRLQGIAGARVLEVVTPPSDLTLLLEASPVIAGVETVDEMALAGPDQAAGRGPAAQAALLLESLDRVDDPQGLLRAVVRRLADGGLVFVTALVASGFDLTVLGLRSRYLYPPDRANCFTLDGLSRMLREAGLALLEVSTPGALDLEIVRAHARQDASIPLSAFERRLLEADADTHAAFQAFLQQQGLSSFARLVARKEERG